MTPQVEPDHYASDYEGTGRWASYYHQVRAVLAWNPADVLEVGLGTGFTRDHLRTRGVRVTTVDLDPRLNPDVTASVDALGVRGDAVDVVSCCQVLEHVPFERACAALAELARVARRGAVVSLPDADRVYQMEVRSPVSRGFRFRVRVPFPKRVHAFDGEHHWEVGRRGYPLARVTEAMEDAGFSVRETYRIFENPYHRFFILDAP